MREELQKREGRRGRFTATFSRDRWTQRYRGRIHTALFLDVRDERGDLVTDHLWFMFGRQMHELNLRPGDRVVFMATVKAYLKSNPDAKWADDYDDVPRRVTDYKLAHPSNMRLVGGEIDESSLPLFSGGQRNDGEAMPTAGLSSAGVGEEGALLLAGVSAQGLQRTQTGAAQNEEALSDV